MIFTNASELIFHSQWHGLLNRPKFNQPNVEESKIATKFIQPNIYNVLFGMLAKIKNFAAVNILKGTT